MMSCFCRFHVDRTFWPLGGELHLPAPDTLSHLPKRKKTTKQPSPRPPLPSTDDSLTVVTLRSAAPELVTRGVRAPSAPPTGLDSVRKQAATAEIPKEGKRTWHQKAPRKADCLTLTLPPPVPTLRARSTFLLQTEERAFTPTGHHLPALCGDTMNHTASFSPSSS